VRIASKAMRHFRHKVLNVVACLAALSALALASALATADDKIPEFRLRDLNGKITSFSTVSQGKPVLFIYLESGSEAGKCIRDMNRLSVMLHGKVKVVGIFPDVLHESQAFSRRNHVKFPVLCDTLPIQSDTNSLLASIGDRYGTNVFSTALVLPNRKIVAKYGGYSSDTLKSSFKKLANATDAKLSISLKGFPSRLVSGGTRIFGATPP
jgi:peroxiredoxin